MDAEVVTQLVLDAKYLFDHGAFGPLQQAEFFKAIAEEVEAPAPSPPPAPAPSEPPAPAPSPTPAP